jgi:hypothetical protein
MPISPRNPPWICHNRDHMRTPTNHQFLVLGLFFKQFFNRFFWVHSAQLVVILKNVASDSRGYLILDSLLSLRGRSRSVPFILLSSCLSLLSSYLWFEWSLRCLGSVRFVWIHTPLLRLNSCSSLFSLLLNGLIPFLGNILLPVLILPNFIYPLSNNLKCLSHLEILHEFVIIEIICELQQIINFLFLASFSSNFLIDFFECTPRNLLLSLRMSPAILEATLSSTVYFL